MPEDYSMEKFLCRAIVLVKLLNVFLNEMILAVYYTALLTIILRLIF